MTILIKCAERVSDVFLVLFIMAVLSGLMVRLTSDYVNNNEKQDDLKILSFIVTMYDVDERFKDVKLTKEMRMRIDKENIFGKTMKSEIQNFVQTCYNVFEPFDHDNKNWKSNKDLHFKVCTTFEVKTWLERYVNNGVYGLLFNERFKKISKCVPVKKMSMYDNVKDYVFGESVKCFV